MSHQQIREKGKPGTQGRRFEDTQGEAHVTSSSDWADASTSPGRPVAATGTRNQRERPEQTLPCSLRGPGTAEALLQSLAPTPVRNSFLSF